MARKRSSSLTVSQCLRGLVDPSLISLLVDVDAGVLDSVKRGKKLGESAYNVIENEVSTRV